jgi:hypothetical protein
MLGKIFGKLFRSMLKWIDERYVQIPDGYGDINILVERFDDELHQVDHGLANRLTRTPHFKKSRTVEC